MFWKNKDKPKPKSGGSSKKSSIPSIISKEMHVLGNIVSDGAVDTNGTVDGNIRCQTLTISKEGKVKGEVTADAVYIYGKLEGLIRAKHAHLYSSCHIEGIVMHESLTIEDGAFIDGKCKRTNKISSHAPEAETLNAMNLVRDKRDDEEESDDNPPKIMENFRLIQ